MYKPNNDDESYEKESESGKQEYSNELFDEIKV